MGRDQFDADFGERFRERVAIVGLVPDDSLRDFFDEASGEGGVDCTSSEYLRQPQPKINGDFWRISTGRINGSFCRRPV
jgi:hypothetical protein